MVGSTAAAWLLPASGYGMFARDLQAAALEHSDRQRIGGAERAPARFERVARPEHRRGARLLQRRRARRRVARAPRLPVL